MEIEGRKPAAVFVTSPTYHGICSNLGEISNLCHFHKIPMIVDEAHGAHLGFHPDLPNSALSQGADISIQSTHKVLCSLTQSSMLHTLGTMVDRDQISRCLQTLQSTSPSYLLLSSLDAARAQISENPDTIFNAAIELAVEAKTIIKKIRGISILNFPSFSTFPAVDPLRLTVGVWGLGLSGYEADEILDREHGIVSELSGAKSITFAINLGTCREHVHRLVLGLKHLSDTFYTSQGSGERSAGPRGIAPFEDISMSLSPREAFFASKRKVKVRDSVGEICGELICPYPPGIPVMVPGERITERALDYLLKVKSEGGVISGASDPLLSSIVVCNNA